MSDESGSGLPAPREGGGIERRFSDEEVQELIRRALALQERSATVPRATHPDGLTLDDVRQIAAEVGIDSRFVEVAARDTGTEAAESEHWLAGAPFAWRFRRTIPGRIPESELGRIVDEIRTFLGQKGEVEDVFGTLEWSYDDGLGTVIVAIRNRDGETEIDVSSRRGQSVGLAHGLVTPFGGIILGALVSGLAGITGPAALPLIGGGMAVSYLGSRLTWKARSRVWERKLCALAERVAAEAGRVAGRIPPGDEAALPPGAPTP